MTATDNGHWLPRADGALRHGELLRRSFENRLERREESEQGESEGTAAIRQLDRFHAAELERQAAVAAVAELPVDLRQVLARVLALPPEAQTALADLLE